ncbi:MAG: 4Fe-4S dicluster domain-containing protein [Steroidobacteraceae bacterium]
MTRQRFPRPQYAFDYRRRPHSGNVINGLGESSPRRATPIFHGSGRTQLEWQALESFFALTMPFYIFLQNLRNKWLLRKANGPVARTRRTPGDETESAAFVKQRARSLGAGAVGIARIDEDCLYEGYDPGYSHGIVVLCPMDHAEMQHLTETRAAVETMRVYAEISRVVIALAAEIRALGWPAAAYGEGADLLHLPLAIRAGLGQLGKHGSLINREFGSNCRIATVLTTMPLASDEPVDIAVDDLCAGCRRCTIDCPADAILPEKQMVRGVRKWYVDFDRCVPYFVKTMGCGICIEVCPWTRPGRGASLAGQLLAKREKRARRQAAN